MPVVANHMTKDLLTLEAEATLGAAAKRMAERGVGAVVVLAGERLAGILTERDILNTFQITQSMATWWTTSCCGDVGADCGRADRPIPGKR